MDDVRGDFLGPPHGTTPAAVIANKQAYVTEPTLFSMVFSAMLIDVFRDWDTGFPIRPRGYNRVPTESIK